MQSFSTSACNCNPSNTAIFSGCFLTRLKEICSKNRSSKGEDKQRRNFTLAWMLKPSQILALIPPPPPPFKELPFDLLCVATNSACQACLPETAARIPGARPSPDTDPGDRPSPGTDPHDDTTENQNSSPSPRGRNIRARWAAEALERRLPATCPRHREIVVKLGRRRAQGRRQARREGTYGSLFKRYKRALPDCGYALASALIFKVSSDSSRVQSWMIPPLQLYHRSLCYSYYYSYSYPPFYHHNLSIVTFGRLLIRGTAQISAPLFPYNLQGKPRLLPAAKK